jgi:hypothetical protein
LKKLPYSGALPIHNNNNIREEMNLNWGFPKKTVNFPRGKPENPSKVHKSILMLSL